MEYYDVGNIVNTQGLRGELRVISSTDFPEERFKKKSQLSLFDSKDNYIKDLTVASSRQHKNFYILSFLDHPSINDVEGYKGMKLKVSADQQGELEENAYYFHEILGLEVFDQDDNKIGQIDDILQLGPNDVWVVRRPKKSDALIPYIEDIVKEVDLENNRVVIEVIEGLIDDEN